MKNILKTLALVAIGVAVGRASKNNYLNGKYKTVTIDPNPTFIEIKNRKIIVTQVLLGQQVTTEAHRVEK